MVSSVIGLRGTIINFRIGMGNPKFRQLILYFENLPPGMKPDNLIGRVVEVRWKGETFKGRIYKKHGKKFVRAIFDKGLPGNVLDEAEVVIVK